MPSDGRIRDHAKTVGWRYQWRTWRDGAHWHAEVQAWKDGESVGWFGSSTIEGEQLALDRAIDLLLAEDRRRQAGPAPPKPSSPHPCDWKF